MDLSALMNDGAAEEERKKSPPEMQRKSQPLQPVGGAGQPPPPSYGTPSHAQTPLYPPPSSAGGVRPPQNQGLTPLQTLSQAPGGGHYPFPPPHQSPASGQVFRPFEGHSATNPGGRPPSHGFQYPQASPSQHLPPGLHAHPSTSLSPTPSSHHSQTPHSVRQSPLSAMSHAPHAPSQQHQYQHSQPNTPLGPPPPHFSRSMTDITSPYHQRTFSGASNGVLSGSPAQHHPSIGNLVESPNAVYNRPSPQLRRTSDYLSQVDRERSLSVSPKTKVPPRPPSLGSRHSSLQEYCSSNRSSGQTNVGPFGAGSPSHVTQPQPPHFGVAPPQPFAQPPNGASEVTRAAPSSLQGVQPPNSLWPGEFAQGAGSLSQQHMNNQPPPAPPLVQHHSSQKMGMNHLLTPTSEVPPTLNGNSVIGPGVNADMGPKRTQSPPNIFMKPTSKPKRPADQALPPRPVKPEFQDQRQLKTEAGPSPDRIPLPQGPVSTRALNLVTENQQFNEPNSANDVPSSQISHTLKRPASEALSSEPPPKQQRRTTRPYAQPPPWAQLSRHNPRFGQNQNAHSTAAMQQTQTQQNGVLQRNGGPQPNGHSNPNNAAIDGRQPWQHDPPLDMDLIKATQVLGKWEKTFHWNTPYPDTLKVVQDWLYLELDKLEDVGMDPKEGTIEIEAKIGTLLQENSDERVNLPIASMAVIRPDMNGRCHFESQMTLVRSSSKHPLNKLAANKEYAARTQNHERSPQRRDPKIPRHRAHPHAIQTPLRNRLLPRPLPPRPQSPPPSPSNPHPQARAPPPHHNQLQNRRSPRPHRQSPHHPSPHLQPKLQLRLPHQHQPRSQPRSS